MTRQRAFSCGKRMMCQVLKLSRRILCFITHLTRKEGGHPTQKPNSKPKPHQNKNHVHNGHVRPTEGWQLTMVKGSVSQIHTGKKEERDAKPVARSMYQIRKVQDMVKNCFHQTNRVFLRRRDATLSSDDTARETHSHAESRVHSVVA